MDHKRLEKNKTIGKPSAKTIQEDIGYWTRILSKEETCIYAYK